VLGDQVLKKHVAEPLTFGRKHDQALEHRRYLHHTEKLFRLLASPVLQKDGNVQALIVNVREWMTGIDSQGSEDGIDFAGKKSLDMFAFRLRQLVVPNALDSLLLQRRSYFLIEDTILLCNKLVSSNVYLLQNVFRRRTVSRIVLRLHTCPKLLLETCHTNLEELVEV
jgi:hypothetical protein